MVQTMCKLAIALMLLLVLSACGEADYYLHSITGHLDVISKRQSISVLRDQESTSEQLQQQLADIEQIRDFASQKLLLPENDSYRSYVELDRPYVVWNVVATPEFSLEPLEWCFPVVGCVNYRGYFDHNKAQQFAKDLKQASNDTVVVGVPAYSTLSWFDDPALSTFSSWPKTSVAKLIFHELAHQKLYIADDTEFNESFATAVEQFGTDLWLEQSADPALLAKYSVQRQRQQQFLDLLLNARQKLGQLYESQETNGIKRQKKQIIFTSMRTSYRELRTSWQEYPGYNYWFKKLNNASFAATNNYHRWVPAFKLAMLQEQQSLESFYRRSKAIAELPAQQRHQLLNRLSEEYRMTHRK